jgi:hypothetical protein
MNTSLNSLFTSKDIRAEIYTQKGNVYNVLYGNTGLLYYINDDYKSLLNNRFNEGILKNIISEGILKIKNKDKVLWETNFKRKPKHVPILNIISVKSPDGNYFNINRNDSNFQVEDYESNASIIAKNNEITIEKWEYSNDTLNFIICCIICLMVKNGANVDENVSIIKNKQIEVKQMSEFAQYCNCDTIQFKQNKRLEFCKYSKTKILSLINQINQENFTDITLKIWDLLYMYLSPNRAFDLNVFIDRYLSEYLHFCNVGELIINYTNYTIEGINQNNLLNKLKKCKTKPIINVKVVINDYSHANILVIENNQVWKYEPNISTGFRQKNMEKYVDIALTEYFKSTPLIYRGLHQESCGLHHSGLCKFISFFKLIYGNTLTNELLQKNTTDFFKWLIKKVCSNWNTVRERFIC